MQNRVLLVRHDKPGPRVVMAKLIATAKVLKAIAALRPWTLQGSPAAQYALTFEYRLSGDSSDSPYTRRAPENARAGLLHSTSNTLSRNALNAWQGGSAAGNW